MRVEQKNLLARRMELRSEARNIHDPPVRFGCMERYVPEWQRFSLACLGFSFLFRGVERGYFSFQK